MDVLRQGLRLRIAHVMIVVVYCACLFAGLAWAFKWRELRPATFKSVMLALVVLAQPHIARVLILYLGRPGPLRTWFAVQCRTLSDLIVACCLTLAAIWHYWSGVAAVLPYTFLFLLALPAVFFWCKFFRMVVITRPRRCPNCAKFCLIPLVELRQFADSFVVHSAQCASCGFVNVRHSRKGRTEAAHADVPETEVADWLGGLNPPPTPDTSVGRVSLKP